MYVTAAAAKTAGAFNVCVIVCLFCAFCLSDVVRAYAVACVRDTAPWLDAQLAVLF